MPRHPLLSYYGPANPPWCRILVIGHEPDTDERMGTHTGPYDLPAGRRTSFWILSHKAIGRAAGFGEHLRAFAVACRSSPIVYSDASPASHAVGPNALPVPSVTDAELFQHAGDLLALPEARACPVVVISGRVPAFTTFYAVVEPGFQSAGAVVVDVPFFGFAPGSTARALLNPLLKQEVQQRVQRCVQEWAAANGLPFPPAGQSRLDGVFDAFQQDLEEEATGLRRELGAALQDADRRPSECEGERERFAGSRFQCWTTRRIAVGSPKRSGRRLARPIMQATGAGSE